MGKAAYDAEKKKDIKHKDACEQAGYGFQPFATDTSGVISPSSYLYLCRIATAYAVARTSTYQHVAVLTTVTIFLSPFRCHVDVANYRYNT